MERPYKQDYLTAEMLMGDVPSFYKSDDWDLQLEMAGLTQEDVDNL